MAYEEPGQEEDPVHMVPMRRRCDCGGTTMDLGTILSHWLMHRGRQIRGDAPDFTVPNQTWVKLDPRSIRLGDHTVDLHELSGPYEEVVAKTPEDFAGALEEMGKNLAHWVAHGEDAVAKFVDHLREWGADSCAIERIEAHLNGAQPPPPAAGRGDQSARHAQARVAPQEWAVDPPIVLSFRAEAELVQDASELLAQLQSTAEKLATVGADARRNGLAPEMLEPGFVQAEASYRSLKEEARTTLLQFWTLGLGAAPPPGLAQLLHDLEAALA